MVAAPGTLPRPDRLAPQSAAKRRERLFFGGLALALFVVVVAGFGPTYYFRTISGTSRVMTTALHFHGAVFTAWMLTLIVQTTLIANGRSDVHRRVGVAGGVLAGLMTALAVFVPITRFQQGLIAAPPGIPVSALLAIALATVVVFPVLIGAALLLRKRTDYHKRLIMIGTLELVTAAVARLPVIGAMGPIAFFAGTDLFLVALGIYDLRTRGRLHPATLWGGLFLIASQPLRLAIGVSGWWQALAGSLTS